MESNDLMRTGRTKRGGPEQEGDVRDEEGVGAFSQTGRATLSAGPQRVTLTLDLEMG